MYVTFSIVFPLPNSISEPKMALLEQALPPRAEVVTAGREVEDVVLSAVDPTRQKSRDQQDMDEDDQGQGGPGVQCAQQ